MAPCPISECATRIVTVSSRAMVSQQVISGASAAWAVVAACCGPSGTAKPSASPPPVALAPIRNERR